MVGTGTRTGAAIVGATVDGINAGIVDVGARVAMGVLVRESWLDFFVPYQLVK